MAGGQPDQDKAPGDFHALAAEPVLLSVRLVCQVRADSVWVAISDTTDKSVTHHPQRSERFARPPGSTLEDCLRVASWCLGRAATLGLPTP